MDIKMGDYELKYGDAKFYYNIHLNKMKAGQKTPVSYSTFLRRLHSMNLSDAINTSGIPRTKRKSKTPIQDRIRRAELLKNQGVAIIDLTEVDRGYTKHSQVLKKTVKQQTKPSLIDRFISFFKG